MKTKNWFTLLILLMLPLICEAEPVYTLNEQWVDGGDGVQLLDPYYRPGITIKWEGPSKNGKAHGNGTATTYINGNVESVYVGEYKNGIREGKGAVTYPDGTVKKGSFSAGQLTGKGTMESENGDYYEGEFVNYRIHGNGKARWGSGATFEGFFVNDAPYTGKFTDYDGSTVFLLAGDIIDQIIESKNKYKPKTGTKVTEYFDKDWHRTDAKNAQYYRVITYDAPHKPKGVVKDYYMNGKLQGETNLAYVDYDDERKNFVEGKMTTYYPNGVLELEATYLNNRPNGPQFLYYDNGNRSSVLAYENGDLITHIDFYPSGSIMSHKNYEGGKLKDNSYILYEEDGSLCYLVYKEDFVENKKFWEYEGPNGNIRSLSEDILYFDITPYRTLSQSTYSPFAVDIDASLNVFVTRDSASEDLTIGLLVSYKDWENYSGLFIRGNSYSYQEVVGGKCTADLPWTSSSLINEETNLINVSKINGLLTIAVNNEDLFTIESPEFPGEYLVVTANNNSDETAELAFSELMLWLASPNNTDDDGLPDTSDDNITSQGWRGNGSGFFITEDGLIATNYHVVKDAKEIEVTFTRDNVKESYPAAVVMSDKENDLSVIKIESSDFKPMESIPYNFPTRIMDTGTEIFTLGYPFLTEMGEEVKFTDGKISAKTGYKGDKRTYQISAPIQPGNSGGPLFDTKGNLVGINAATLTIAQNANYSIKTKYLKDLVDNLPGEIKLNDNGVDSSVSSLSLVDMLKKLTPYVTLIKIK